MRIMALNQMPEDTKDPDYHQRVQQTLHSYASPGTAIDLCYPDDHPGAAVNRVMSDQHVHTELHYLVSIPALVRKIVWAQEQGYDAVVQTNAFDPGVEAARLAVAIPVIGLCRSSVTLASTLAERIAITVPFEGYVHHTRRILRTYGLERFVTDVRSLDLPGIPRGAEVGERRAGLRAGAITLMRSLIEETRAECIVPLGAAIVPYIVSPTELQQELGVPVLNTTAIGIRLAETCVALGISHSPRTYLPANLAAGDFDQLAYARVTGDRR
jgi:allantoin racemase